MIYLIGNTGYVGKNLSYLLSKQNLKFLSNYDFGGKLFFNIIDCSTHNNLIEILEDNSTIILLPWGVQGEYWNATNNVNFLFGYIEFLKNVNNSCKNIKIIISGTGVEIYGEFNEINSLYSLSKKTLYYFIKNSNFENIKFYWVRIFNTFGLYESPNRFTPYLIKKLKNKSAPIIKNPKKLVYFDSINYLCEIIFNIITNSINSDSTLTTINGTNGLIISLEKINLLIACIIEDKNIENLFEDILHTSEQNNCVDLAKYHEKHPFYFINDLAEYIEIF